MALLALALDARFLIFKTTRISPKRTRFSKGTSFFGVSPERPAAWLWMLRDHA
jgi:hypothetical protein